MGVEVQLQSFLTSALDGCEWSVSHPGRFITLDEIPMSVRRRLAGPYSQSGYFEEERNLGSRWDWNPGRSSP